jgi:transcriptional regulator with XRE-family HTH domain
MILKFENFFPAFTGDPTVFKKEFTEEEVSRAFGLSLKKLRNHKNLSLNALSEIVDIPNPTINRYENGINIPTITQAIKLSSFFDISIEIMIAYGIADMLNETPEGKDIIAYYELIQQSKGVLKLATNK